MINNVISSFQTPTTPEEWRKIAEDFNLKWNFPMCVGAIDGKYVQITPPASSGSYYFNYEISYFNAIPFAFTNHK